MKNKELLYKILIGFFSGIINGLFATGGGLILVPAFIYLLKMDDKKARANSIICVLPMVITSVLFYYRNELINWKIGIICAIGGVFGGVLGARLLNKVDPQYLKVVFCLFLIYSSYKMFIN